MKLILLSGMDGTGLLFANFVQKLEYEYSIVSYDSNKKQSYDELIKVVSKKIKPENSYIIIAESFSGFIAYELLKKHKNIISVIFVASFISSPNRLLWFFKKYVPSSLIPLNPPRFFSKLLLGKMATTQVIRDFQEVLSKVKKVVFAFRIKEMAHIVVDSQKINIRCSYLRPRNDILVSSNCVKIIKDKCQDFRMYNIAGSHFVLQVNPSESAKIINKEIEYILFTTKENVFSVF